MAAPLRPTSSRTLALMLLFAAAAITALGILRVHRQHAAVDLGYDLARATAELREVREENRSLRLELATLTAPDRIEELARAMGLGPPSASQIRSADAPGAPGDDNPAEADDDPAGGDDDRRPAAPTAPAAAEERAAGARGGEP